MYIYIYISLGYLQIYPVQLVTVKDNIDIKNR